MQSFTKLFVAVVFASVAAASPAPAARQLSGLPSLPSLPVCLTGSLAGEIPALPTGVSLTSCASGETCTAITSAISSVPILGSILGGVADELPVGVGLCM